MSTPKKSLRYQLPPKAIKGDCPDCSPKHRKTLSRYVDTRTDEALSPEFGRCDRERSCGYHLSPYHKGPSGMSYADTVFEQLKADNPQPSIRAPRQQPRRATTAKPTTLSSPPTFSQIIHEIPRLLVDRSLGHYEHNQLATLLRGHFGPSVAEALLQRFQIGTSAHWPGACIFWYIDEQGRVRGGQIKLLGPDGHTVKYVDREGVKRSKTNWVHSVLQDRLEKEGEALPDWLLTYRQQGSVSPCLFGLPQLDTAPPDQPIAIVEAPKTAIIATAYFPQFVWMAVGAKSYLNAERLGPLRNRSLLLWPDLDAYHDIKNAQGRSIQGWLSKAAQLTREGFDIEVSDFLERHATDDQKQRGDDLADFLLRLPPLARRDDSPVSQSPLVVKTFAEWAANPGSTLRPEASQLQYL